MSLLYFIRILFGQQVAATHTIHCVRHYTQDSLKTVSTILVRKDTQ